MKYLYDWSEVQRYYDRGNSYRACRKQFGFASASWTKAVRRGDIVPRPAKRSIEEVLNTPGDRGSKKRRLLQAGLLQNRCSECGLDTWLSEPISIQLDHINGDRNDWRLKNLRMLCPNCHSQTATYGASNPKRRRSPRQPCQA